MPALAILDVQDTQALVDSGRRIDSHRVVVDEKEKPAIIDLAAQRLSHVRKLPFHAVFRTQDLQSSFVPLAVFATFGVIMMLPIIFAMLGFIMAFLLFAAFLPFRMQFQTRHAALRIAVALDISIAFAQADDQDFVLVRRRVDSQVEASDLKLQHAVVDESTYTRGHVYLVCRRSPLRSHEFSALRHCRTRQQEQAERACKYAYYSESHKVLCPLKMIGLDRPGTHCTKGHRPLGEFRVPTVTLLSGSRVHLSNYRVGEL